MKKWIVRLVIGFVILVVIGLVAAFLSLNTLVKTGVDKIGPRVTQTDVRLDSANISPFSGSGQLHGLFVGNPAGYKTPSAIKVGDVRLAVDVKSVFSNVVVVNSIVVESPEVTLEGELTGLNNNLSRLLANINTVAGTDEPTKTSDAKPSEGGKKFRVKDILIKGTIVNASVTVLGGKALTVTLPDIHLTDIGTDDKGVSAAELTQKLIQEIRAGALKAVASSLGKQFEGLGKDTGKQVEKASKGLKSLFRK